MPDSELKIDGLQAEQSGSGSKRSSYSDFIGNVSSDDTLKRIVDYIHAENKTQYGYMSKFFGTEKNASKNITFTVLFLIMFIFFCLSGCVREDTPNTNKFLFEVVKELLPLFTLAFGYFFGKQ